MSKSEVQIKIEKTGRPLEFIERSRQKAIDISNNEQHTGNIVQSLLQFTTLKRKMVQLKMYKFSPRLSSKN